MPKKSKKQSYSNILKEYDTFESRINLTNQSLYYFNPVSNNNLIVDNNYNTITITITITNNYN